MRTAAGQASLEPVLERCAQIDALETALGADLSHLPSDDALQSLTQKIDSCHEAGIESGGETELVQLADRLAELLPALNAAATAVAPLLASLGMPGVAEQAAIPQEHAAIRTLVRCAMGTLHASFAVLDARFLSSSLPAALGRAHQVRDDLLAEQEAIEQDLGLADTPDDDELKQLRQVLRDRPGAWCAWLGLGPLAKARRRVRAFTTRTELAKAPSLVARLEQVPAWRAKVVAFAREQELVARIGSLFQGMDTNWAQLDDAVAVVQALGRLVDRSKVKAIIDEQRLDQLGDLDLTAIEDALTRYADQAAAAGGVWEPLARQPFLEGVHTAGTATTQVETLLEAVPVILGFYHQAGDHVAAWNLPSLTAKLRQATQRVQLQQEIGSNHAARQLLPTHLNPAALPLKALIASGTWSKAVLNRTELEPIADWLLADPTAHTQALSRYLVACHEAHAAFAQAADRLAVHGTVEAPSAWNSQAPMPLATALERLDAAHADGAVLTDWSRLCIASDAASALGLKSIVASVQTHELVSTCLQHALNADAYERVATYLLGSVTPLRTFQRQQHDRRRSDFFTKDAKLADHAQAAIVDRLLDTDIPDGVRGRRASELTERHLIVRELEKSRMHIPIRQLILRAPKALSALKPLWMMSPLSVAYYVPLMEVEFDLVVMDEASQIRPEDAMGAMFRAKQVIVVGDSKQMPPTNFFQFGGSVEDEEEDAYAIQEVESILGACRSAFQSIQLQWHYRSKHESLIAFSNRQYYNDTLDVFPSKNAKSDHLGIQWRKVEGGCFQGQRNRIEAEAVVEAVYAHASRCRTLPDARRTSLGVATMNIKQRDLILDLLEKRALESPEDDELHALLQSHEDPLFVKNLENIQGDERDHIMISCTYGKDKDSGEVMQRFGPLAQNGGERRLNVLFTRARQKVTVFSSMEPESDLRPSPATKQGFTI
jgi:hypothetical protein